MYTLEDAYSMSEVLNNSHVWQDRIFYVLAALYGIVSCVALIQFVRIQKRFSDHGWTMQKVFHLFNFLVHGARCVVFVFRRDIQQLTPEIARTLVDLPNLAFFTTYAVLIMFWTEIYYQARSISIDGLKPAYLRINGIIYAIQIVLWLVIWWNPIHIMVILSKVFFPGVSLFTALGFLLSGGRLFLMVKRFPVESRGRQKKLREIVYVTTICFSCFLVRFIMLCFDEFNESTKLGVLEHPVLSFIYYLLVEILPSSLVLFILRGLPPKKKTT